jgi:hypothetical protein
VHWRNFCLVRLARESKNEWEDKAGRTKGDVNKNKYTKRNKKDSNHLIPGYF